MSGRKAWGLPILKVFNRVEVLPHQPWQTMSVLDLTLCTGTLSCLNMFGAFSSHKGKILILVRPYGQIVFFIILSMLMQTYIFQKVYIFIGILKLYPHLLS